MSDDEVTLGPPLDRLAPEELNQLAVDVVRGAVFWSQDPDVIRFSFLPVALAATLPANLGLVYEYVDRAGPLAVNGRPIFTSVRLLAAEDLAELQALVEAKRRALAEAGT